MRSPNFKVEFFAMLRQAHRHLLQCVLVARLQKASLPTLQDDQRALQGVHRVHQLAFRRRERSLLLFAELGGLGKLRFRAGDLACELLDLRAELADAGRGVRDLRLEIPDRALVGGDCVFLLVGLRVTPLRVPGRKL